MDGRSIMLMYAVLVAAHGLDVGFYSNTCPDAESVVKTVVGQAALHNPRVPAILLRLHFHDCFVEGCDGSILLTDVVGEPEKDAVGHQGVQGLIEISRAKQALESLCPGVVSCADIVAMAARDAIALAGGPVYAVETGRKDGRVSSSSLAVDMPEAHDAIDVLKSKFFNKGLSEAELVLLSGGAHTIGTAACLFITERLYTFMGANASDPAINPALLPSLQQQCPRGGDVRVRTPLDPVTPSMFDDQSLLNIKSGLSVLPSDAVLYNDVITRMVVDSYTVENSTFARDFAAAMVKMGKIGVKLGDEGEIRQVCNTPNQARLVITAEASRKRNTECMVVFLISLMVLMVLF